MKRLIKLKTKIKITIGLVFVLFVFTSCEDDFTTLGSGFINSLNLPEPYVVQNLATYSDNILSVQSNTLNNYLLGNYQDPVFGSSEVSILTQLELQNTNPDFGQDPVLDSVVFTLPLYSSLIETNTYQLDSVFGDGSFKISIFESNQFLNDIDPSENGEFETPQRYYSDQFSEFENNIESNPLIVSEQITPSELTETQILFDQIDTTNVDTLRVSPRIRIKLPNEFFQEKILNNQNTVNLVSQSSFKNFLRGLYIKTEQHTNGGAMINLNLNNQDAKITLYYKSLRPAPSLEVENNNELIETFNKFNLNFSGNIINFYENDNTIDLALQDTINGEENLFVKGGQGIVTIVDPFNGPDNDGNGVADEIDQLRQNNWLINEANLIFYVNENLANTQVNKPQRILVFDADHNRVLVDYSLDPSASNNPLISRLNHLGPLQEDENGNAFYKIRLTNHINNIINNDSTSTKIGVVVTQNVNQARILDIRDSQLDQVETYIESSISTPRGTVFHGNLSADEEKRLKLQIYYTEPN
ncbi:DUF4270 domain-containing protein [Flavobacterium sp. CS20]|uniref:DUF4270 domain-containing protein n=1 Tax=Flavobacterium sp. CS20 TaxID=2775246 RepID=UPI001B39EADD|nr:DUF4270 domain-containing protein [Flavobacterium sp. CS20]QTY26041.1 DUF4270 domain-containing protein [Flavobacterium sp. CS20]